MKNIGKRAKKNPWRNTRNDFKVPWESIWAKVFIVILPIVIILIANNLIVRSGTFYSYYLSKTGVVKEIPYDIENKDLIDTFGDFMIHKKATFSLQENSEYKPQQVFNTKDQKVMKTIRNTFDIMLITGALLAIFVMSIVIYLFRKGEKKLLYESYKKSLVWFGVLLGGGAIVYLIPAVRKGLFYAIFDMKFPPGDVLIQLFEMKLITYYGYFQIVASLILMGMTYYLMYRFVNSRKMFKWNR